MSASREPTPAPLPGMPAWVGKALLTIALVLFLIVAKPVLLPLTVAILLTFLLYGPVRGLTQLGVPPALGAALVVGALLAVLGIGVSALAEPAASWWERAPQTLERVTQAVDEVRSMIPGLEPPRRPARAATPPPDPVKEELATQGVTMTRAVLKHVLNFAIFGAATVILLYFLLASEYRLLSRTVQAIPNTRTRIVVLSGVRQAQREIGTYLATACVINGALGLAAGVVFAKIGLPNPLLWGTVVAVLNFVPYIGPLILCALLMLVGLLTFGVSLTMLAPAAVFLALHAIESNFVTPLVVGRRLRLSPMAVFLSVMVWGWIWGVAGAFIAVPMLLALRAACRRVPQWRLLAAYLTETANPPVSLAALVRHPEKRRAAAAAPTRPS